MKWEQMRFFRPDEYYASVLSIEPRALVERGFKGVLLDVDNTLMPRTDAQVPARMADWVQRCQEAGLATLVLSNSFQDRVLGAVEQLGTQFIGKAMKPLPGGYRKACRQLGLHPQELVMVGDQTYTDILGAHLAGMHAILVQPLGSVDLGHTRLLRKLDRIILHKMPPQGEFPHDIYTL